MKRISKLLVFFFFTLQISAQERTNTLSLFYNINEVRSETNFSRLDSLNSILSTGTSTLTIYGYADFLNTDSYNQNLSKNRAEAVKHYFLSKNANIKIAACKGLGEKNSKDNSSADGEPMQRRVDIIIIQAIPRKKIAAHDNEIQEEKKIVPTEPKNQKDTQEKGIEDLEAGESLVIKGLNFIAGRHVLVKSALPVLEGLVKTLKENPQIKIEIQGHICCLDLEEGDGLDYDTNEHNLSENRAKYIYNYLVKKGIKAERMTYKGYGHTMPKINPETSTEDEQINRRVEIKILDN